ncbi:hypothetical protein JB92DRAFT_2558251, partial [Gautieria morchelliformis]
WVQELLDGHLVHICNKLGVYQHVFLALIKPLQGMGHMDSCQGVKLEEQLTIFLY